MRFFSNLASRAREKFKNLFRFFKPPGISWVTSLKSYLRSPDLTRSGTSSNGKNGQNNQRAAAPTQSSRDAAPKAVSPAAPPSSSPPFDPNFNTRSVKMFPSTLATGPQQEAPIQVQEDAKKIDPKEKESISCFLNAIDQSLKSIKAALFFLGYPLSPPEQPEQLSPPEQGRETDRPFQEKDPVLQNKRLKTALATIRSNIGILEPLVSRRLDATRAETGRAETGQIKWLYLLAQLPQDRDIDILTSPNPKTQMDSMLKETIERSFLKNIPITQTTIEETQKLYEIKKSSP